MRLSFGLLGLSALVLSACGVSGVGGGCSRPGSDHECVEGAICATDEGGPDGSGGDPVWDSYTCRAVCAGPMDCPLGEECRAVAGTGAGTAPVTACQPPRTP
jgi:hypothetical protein